MGKIAAGTINVLVDNVTISVFGDWEYALGIKSSELEASADGHVADIVTNMVPFIRGKGRDRSDLDVLALISASDVPVQFTLENGKTVVMENCKQVTQGEQSSGDAGISLEFRSQTRSIKEIQPAA